MKPSVVYQGRKGLVLRAITAFSGAAPLLVAFVIAAFLCCPAAGQEAGNEPSEEEEVDRLSLAALLIRDGFFDRAETVLAEVDMTEEGLDLSRFYTLRGLIRLQRQDYEKAREDLQHAIQLGRDEPLLHLYLAQAWYGLEEYEETLRELDLAGETAAAQEGVHKMRILSHFQFTIIN